MRPQLSTIIIAVLAIFFLAYVINPTGFSAAFSIQPPEEQPSIEKQAPIAQLAFAQNPQTEQVQNFGISAVNDTSLASLSSTAFVNPEGTGDVLIFPYYNLRYSAGGTLRNTFVITNIDTQNGVILKIRFAKNTSTDWGYKELFAYLPANATGSFDVNWDGAFTRANFNNPLYFVGGYNSGTNSFMIGPLSDPLSQLLTPFHGTWTQDSAREGSVIVFGIEKAPATLTTSSTLNRTFPAQDAPNKLQGNAFFYNNQGLLSIYDAEAIANFYNSTFFGNTSSDVCITDIYPGTQCEPYLFGNTQHVTNDNQTAFILSKKSVISRYENDPYGMTPLSNIYTMAPLANGTLNYFTYDMFDMNENNAPLPRNTAISDSVTAGIIGPTMRLPSPTAIPLPTTFPRGWLALNFYLFSRIGSFDFFGNSYNNYTGLPILGFTGTDWLGPPAWYVNSYAYLQNWQENSLYLNPGKIGDVIICPYWTVEDASNLNYITIVNTNSSNGVVYKFRMTSPNGTSLIEQDFLLSANDTNYFEIGRSGSDIILNFAIPPLPPDDRVITACTTNSCNFATPSLITQSNVGNFSGYIEIIAEEATPSGAGVAAAEGAIVPSAVTSFTRLKTDAPNSLYAEMWFRNTGTNRAYSYQCTALANFNKNGTLFKGVSNTQSANPFARQYFGPYLDDAQEGLDKLEMVLSKSSLNVQYVYIPGMPSPPQVKTKIIYTMPTKHFHYSNTTGNLIPSASNPFTRPTMNTSESFYINAYNTTGSPRPGLPYPLWSSSFVDEVNVLDETKIISGGPAFPNPDSNFNGWFNIDFSNHNATPANSSSWDYLGTVNISKYYGLPIVGVVVKEGASSFVTTGNMLPYQMNLTRAILPYCGDASCSGNEDCSSCSADCGTCPAPAPGGGGTNYVVIPPKPIPPSGPQPSFISIPTGTSYDKALSIGEYFLFYSNGDIHTIVRSGENDGYIQFTLTSEPIKVVLKVGETKRIDTNNNGIEDLELTLLSVSGGFVNVRIQSLPEGAVQPITPIKPAVTPPAQVHAVVQKQALFALPNVIILALAILLFAAIVNNYRYKQEMKYAGEKKLYRFVGRALDEGHTEEYIFQRLIQAGWKHEQIDRALRHERKGL